MPKRILIANVDSTSYKYTLFDVYPSEECAEFAKGERKDFPIAAAR